MIDFNAAKEIARRHIAGVKAAPGIELVLIEKRIIERPFGWVFFFDSKRYLETRDRKYTVLGAPFIVDRRDGSLHPLKTAPPVQYYIEQYEREHPMDISSAPPHAGPAHRQSQPPRSFIIAGAVLILAAIGWYGWLKLRPSAADSVPVLSQYAPKDSHDIIQSVSLSSSMAGQDFDTARVGTKFDSGIKSAVLWYRWSNAAPGAVLQIAWSKDDSEILQQQVQIATSSGEQAFALRTPDGATLPDGHYQVALLEAGKLVTSIPFQIGR